VPPVDGAALLRRALLKFDATRVLGVVDSLNLQPSARVAVVVGPLRSLKKSRDVSLFVRSAPIAAVRYVIELLSSECLERVVALLGEHSENPSFEELSAAVDELPHDEFDSATLAAMLATAAASGVPATSHCVRLLEEREALHLPDVTFTPSEGLLQPKTVDPLVRAQRRQRREAQKKARSGATSQLPSRKKAAAVVMSRPVSLPEPAGVQHVTESTRRLTLLTPRERADFSPDHALAGFVIEVEIAYGDGVVDDDWTDAKRRPALVIAGGESAILVRPVYSKETPHRTLLSGWNRLGLLHPSYVDQAHVVVPLLLTDSFRRFGRLTDEEWNALL
jgi:hypothetical protein